MKTTQTNRRLTKEQRALRDRNQREMDGYITCGLVGCKQQAVAFGTLCYMHIRMTEIMRNELEKKK